MAGGPIVPEPDPHGGHQHHHAPSLTSQHCLVPSSPQLDNGENRQPCHAETLAWSGLCQTSNMVTLGKITSSTRANAKLRADTPTSDHLRDMSSRAREASAANQPLVKRTKRCSQDERSDAGWRPRDHPREDRTVRQSREAAHRIRSVLPDAYP